MLAEKKTRSKKISKVIIGTTMLIGIAHFAIYPESHSKYLDKNLNAISYSATIHPKYKGTIPIEQIASPPSYATNATKPKSDWQTAYFEFAFSRNNFGTNQESDRYTILTNNNACNIVGMDSSGNIDTTKYGNTYTQYQSDEEDITKVVLECSVDKLKQGTDLYLEVQIKDTINGDHENAFIYKDGDWKLSQSAYYSKYPKPADPEYVDIDWNANYLRLPASVSENFFDNLKENLGDLANTLPDFDFNLTDKSLYGIFKEIWLEKIVGTDASYTPYIEEIKNYVLNSYNTQESIFDANTKLKGLNVIEVTTETSNGNTSSVYEYTLDSSLVGYARTFDAYQDRGNYNIMYFSEADEGDKDLLKNIFAYYLEEYPDKFSITNSQEKELIMKYIDTFENGMIDILNNKSTGMIYDNNLNRLVLQPNLIEDAYEKVNNIIRIPVKNASEEARDTALSDGLSNMVDKNIKDDIYLDDDIYYWLIADYKSGYSESKTFIGTKHGNLIMIRLFSDDEYNYVQVILPEGENKDTFRISFVTEEDTLKAIQSIDAYINEVIKPSEVVSHTELIADEYITIIKDAEGNITEVVYNTNPNIADEPDIPDEPQKEPSQTPSIPDNEEIDTDTPGETTEVDKPAVDNPQDEEEKQEPIVPEEGEENPTNKDIIGSQETEVPKTDGTESEEEEKTPIVVEDQEDAEKATTPSVETSNGAQAPPDTTESADTAPSIIEENVNEIITEIPVIDDT